MIAGMFLTMAVRQIAIICSTPKYIGMLFLLGFLGILMQIAQVWGMLTFLDSKWTGVRILEQKRNNNSIMTKKRLMSYTH